MITTQASQKYEHLSFSEENGDDIFKRKLVAQNLSNCISNMGSQGMVMVLNAPWGAGKTTFIHKWMDLMSDKKDKESPSLTSIYFDAFENDYLENPLLPITAKVIEALGLQNPAEEGLTKKAIKNITPLATKLLARITLGRADIPFFEDDEESDIGEDISSNAEKIIQSQLEKLSTEESTVKAFKKVLETETQNLDTPLVVIIDELDRCKPTFALKTLEIIKHFFSVKNLVFVLSMHKPQFEGYIRGIYGNTLDSGLYLQKFVDIEVALPKNLNSEHYENDIQKYINMEVQNNSFLKKYLSSNNRYQYKFNDMLQNIRLASEKNNYEPRNLNKILNNVSILLGSFNLLPPFASQIIPMLAILKEQSSENYKRLCTENQPSATELCNLLNIDISKENRGKIIYWLLGEEDKLSEEEISLIRREVREWYRGDNGNEFLKMYKDSLDLLKISF